MCSGWQDVSGAQWRIKACDCISSLLSQMETKKLPACKRRGERVWTQWFVGLICVYIHLLVSLNNPVNKLEAMCYWGSPTFCGLPLESGKTPLTSVGSFTLPKLHLALSVSCFSALCFHWSKTADGKSKNRVQEGWWVISTVLSRAGWLASELWVWGWRLKGSMHKKPSFLVSNWTWRCAPPSSALAPVLGG